MIIYLALAISTMSFTFCVTSIFLEVREFLSRIHPKIEQLVHCPFCMSFYISFVLLLFCRDFIILFSNYIVLNFILTVFTLMAISGIIHFVLLRAYEPVSETMIRRKIRNSK